MTTRKTPVSTLSAEGMIARRSFLKLGGATSALAIAKSMFPAGVHAQGSGPEVKGTKLGYIALTDASPLIIA